MSDGVDIKYWFNLKTKKVELGPLSLSLERLGPFSTYDEALRAPEIIEQRARKIREDDERNWLEGHS